MLAQKMSYNELHKGGKRIGDYNITHRKGELIGNRGKFSPDPKLETGKATSVPSQAESIRQPPAGIQAISPGVLPPSGQVSPGAPPRSPVGKPAPPAGRTQVVTELKRRRQGKRKAPSFSVRG